MIFKDIPNNPDFQVSDTGMVKRKQVVTIRSNGWPINKKERLLKLERSSRGYIIVAFCRNGKRTTEKVHRLVAITFIPNPNNYREVNHKNGIKSDNRVENLQWCTRAENIKHAFDNGLRSHKGENNTNCKVSAKDVLEIRQKYKDGIPVTQISKEYGIWTTSVSNIISKRTWKYI